MLRVNGVSSIVQILVLIQHKKSSKIAEIMDPAAVRLHLCLLLEPLPFEAVFCIRRLSDAYWSQLPDVHPSFLLVSNHKCYADFTHQEASLDNLLLGQPTPGIFWEQHIVFPIYICKDNGNVEKRLGGQNSKRVHIDAISREARKVTPTRESIFLHEKLSLVFETDALPYKNDIVTRC
jgi:hypothetical protein